MSKHCLNCRTSFIVSKDEQDFLDKVSPKFSNKIEKISEPDLCVGCREQNRIAFRNEFNFFKRKCDSSGKSLIAIYPENTPYTVYDPSIWWSDEYDPLKYGRDFNFSKSFFEQFKELNLSVPKAAIQNSKSENSEYTNYSTENKNCYVCSGCAFNEDCLYCSRVVSSKSVCDSYDLLSCEHSYGCLHSSFLYNSAFCKSCHNSSNLFLCDNLIGCHNCIGCHDLNGQKYCIFNKQLSQTDYEVQRKKLITQYKEQGFLIDKLKSTRHEYIIACEDCQGNHLLNCSNCKICFGIKECQDCRAVGLATNSNDCYDCNFMDQCELVYNSTNLNGNYAVSFAALVWGTNDSLYAMNCFNSNNLFGCSGMKRNEYCILNKQYSKTQYHELASKIVAHMRRTGEWSHYFPMSLSPFAYNHSVAQDYYPLNEEQVSLKKLNWYNEEKSESSNQSAENIKICEKSGKAFRISKQELELCTRLEIGTPKLAPYVRRLELSRGVNKSLQNYQ